MTNEFENDNAYCKGCYSKLKIGAIPEQLLISLPGINVWKKCPQTISNPPSSDSQSKSSLSLCLDCFNGYSSGTKKLSLDVLGISIVTAPYAEEERYLKIEGPTKLVNLLNDEQEENEKEAEDEIPEEDEEEEIPEIKTTTKAKSNTPKVTNRGVRRKRRGRKRRIQTKVQEKVRSEESSVNEFSEEQTAVGNPTGFLSVSSEGLGAVEMTDDDFDEQSVSQSVQMHSIPVNLLPDSNEFQDDMVDILLPKVKIEPEEENEEQNEV